MGEEKWRDRGRDGLERKEIDFALCLQQLLQAPKILSVMKQQQQQQEEDTVN